MTTENKTKVMDRDLGLELARVTETAAIASAKWMGRGDKNSADQAAVTGMRNMFDTVNIDGVVVIGEGEKDEAPMLYIGEEIGIGGEDAVKVDIAVDPLDGTTSTAKGLSNAIAVIAIAPRGHLYNTKNFYMEKLAVGPKAKGAIDLEKPLKENLLICCINRDGRILLPRGSDRIQVGDTVIVVTTVPGLQDIRDILA